VFNLLSIVLSFVEIFRLLSHLFCVFSLTSFFSILFLYTFYNILTKCSETVQIHLSQFLPHIVNNNVYSTNTVDLYVNKFLTSNVFLTKLVLETPIKQYTGGAIRADIYVINNDVIIRQCTTGSFYESILSCTFSDVFIQEKKNSKKEFQLQIILTPLDITFQNSIQLSILESMRGVVILSKRRSWLKFCIQVLYSLVLLIMGSLTCCMGCCCCSLRVHKKQVFDFSH
jgi:hypothetical protein